MQIIIEMNKDEVQATVMASASEIIEKTYKIEIKRAIHNILVDKDTYGNIVVKTVKELCRDEINKILKQNSDSIIQLMREEVNKIVRDELDFQTEVNETAKANIETMKGV